MLFRIGINLGDLIHDGARIYGDGINVAARLEGIAEPGGICISRQVFEQVDRALDMVFNALGPRNLKNIARRSMCMRWIGGSACNRPRRSPGKRSRARRTSASAVRQMGCSWLTRPSARGRRWSRRAIG
jgi:class 3 adenylate cyclase